MSATYGMSLFACKSNGKYDRLMEWSLLRTFYKRGEGVKRRNSMIGIICAMESEAALLRAKMTEKKEEVRASVTYSVGKIDGVNVTLLTCGVGKVNAAMHTQILIDFYHPTAIVQSGVAGALSPSVKVFDTVIGSELTYHDIQDFVFEGFGPLEKVYYADPRLVSIAKQAAPNAVVGKIASGDIFVSDEQTKRDIAVRTQALCVEMEGAAVAHTAFLNNIPFVVIRVISDDADKNPEFVFATFEMKAAQRSAETVLRMLPQISETLR